MKEAIFPFFENEIVREIRDESIGLRGFLVTNASINGMSSGGVRMTKTVNLEEIKDLAKIMTLKQAFVGLPRGGTRAGIIIADDDTEARRQQLLNRFGELNFDLLNDRQYIAGPDVGTCPAQFKEMYARLGITIPKTSRTSQNSGYYTSLSVWLCLEECLKILGNKLPGSKIAIEGFGRVAAPLAARLSALGARIVAISNLHGAIYNETGLNVTELTRLRETVGDSFVTEFKQADTLAKEELLELPVDALCPCATDSTINSRNVDKIQSKIICSGANNPVTLAADKYLFENGVLYSPDFVTNCGGVLGNAVEFAGLKEKHAIQLLQEEILPKLKWIYDLSIKESIPPRQVAIKLTEEKLKSLQHGQTRKKGTADILNWGLQLYRKGLVPIFLVRRYALRSLRDRIRR